MAELNAFLNILLQALAAALAPVVAAYIVSLLKSIRARVEAELSAEQWAVVEAVVATVVRAAEQSGLAQLISAEGEEKKRWAIAEAKRILDERGLDIDVATLAALIESEVYRQLHDGQ